MSPSEPPAPPPEILAIAVALAVALQQAEVTAGEPTPPSRWRLSGRTYRWS